MDIALILLESWMVWFLPPAALYLLVNTKSAYQNYMPVICTVIMAFVGYLAGNMIQFGHWCIPCVLSAVLSLSTLFLARVYPKFGSFLIAFFFPFLFFPLLWTLLPGLPESFMLIIFSLWGIIHGSRAIKWQDNFNATFIKAFASGLLLHSSVLVLPRIGLLKQDTFVSYETTYHLLWVILFISLTLIAKPLDKSGQKTNPS